MTDMPDEIWAGWGRIKDLEVASWVTEPTPDATRYIRADRNPWPAVCVQQEEEIARLRRIIDEGRELAKREQWDSLALLLESEDR